ncbi:MAG: hypothetical protein MUC53_11810 [Candidatus Contendobacter sp.]|nr:hypothetical protein [Candidatus Contendobacter sp.]
MYREASPASLVRGSLWMLVAGLLFSAMGVLVKLGAGNFPPPNWCSTARCSASP